METNQKLNLSPSRISDFQTCPQLYKYRSIEKLPERPGLDALRGSIVHLILENIFDLDKNLRTLENAQQKISETTEYFLNNDPNLFCALDQSIAFPNTNKVQTSKENMELLNKEISDLLTNYFKIENPKNINPKSREELIEYELTPEILLKGYVDRIDESEQGLIRINDYKTGKAPNENFVNKAMFQLKFYAYIIYQKVNKVPKSLRLIYLKDSQVLTYEPTSLDMQLTEKKILNIAQQISNAIKEDNFPATTSKLCDYCYFKKICPAYN